MVGYILACLWTLMSVVLGFVLGRSGQKTVQIVPEQEKPPAIEDLLPPSMQKQWENMINYDGTKRGQQELNGDE